MILEVEGVLEVLDFLGDLARLVSSDKLWEPVTTGAAEELRRYAVSISPVVTGAYRDSHHVSFRGMQAMMTIDPGATNRGVPVVDYAGAVEARHQIYERTFAHAGERSAVVGAEALLEGMRL